MSLDDNEIQFGMVSEVRELLHDWLMHLHGATSRLQTHNTHEVNQDNNLNSEDCFIDYKSHKTITTKWDHSHHNATTDINSAVSSSNFSSVLEGDQSCSQSIYNRADDSSDMSAESCRNASDSMLDAMQLVDSRIQSLTLYDNDPLLMDADIHNQACRLTQLCAEAGIHGNISKNLDHINPSQNIQFDPESEYRISGQMTVICQTCESLKQKKYPAFWTHECCSTTNSHQMSALRQNIVTEQEDYWLGQFICCYCHLLDLSRIRKIVNLSNGSRYYRYEKIEHIFNSFSTLRF